MGAESREKETFYFDPQANGLRIFLGPTEADIMEALWQQGPLTAKRLQLFLPDSTRAHTTILTVLAKLVEKGLLSKKKENRQFLFTPIVSREEFLSRRVTSIVRALKKNFKKQVEAAN